ncbi:MAG: hypothetical protein LBD14_00505 [Puniceicoccales bacterium]|jgi:hypothetical protein|nr:hypothetical protein [Puniceicoccales bacterium]
MTKKHNHATNTARRGVTLRERVLLATLLWILALAALTLILKQHKNARAQNAANLGTAAIQDVILNQKDDITNRLARHVERLKSAQSLQGVTFQGLIEKIAAEARINTDSVQSTSKNQNNLQVLTVKLTLRNIPMDRLLVFDDRLRSQTLPITITSLRIDAPEGGRDGLTAIYEISTCRLLDTSDPA